MTSGEAQVAVLKLRWPALVHHFSKHQVPPILRDLVRSEQRRKVASDDVAPSIDFVGELEALEIERRRGRLRDEVRDQVLRVLGLEPNHPIGLRQGLTDVGMDSLMAVELSNRVSVLVDRTLPSTLAFEHPTLDDLSVHLEELLADRIDFSSAVVPSVPGPDRSGEERTGPERPGAHRSVDDSLDDLSSTELTDALMKELDAAGY